MDHVVGRPAFPSLRIAFATSWPRSAAALAVWALICGLPYMRLEGLDDAFYSEAAHLWTQGAPPYVGVFDIKPPGYFALLALAQLAFGPSLQTIHGLSLACDLGVALALYAMGRGLGSPRAGLVAGATFIPLAVMLIENAAYPPLVLVLTLAFLVVLRFPAGGLRALGAGVACGAAICLKQTAALEALALAGLFAWERRAAPLALFLAGTAAIPLAFVVYFACLGGLEAMYRDVIAYALQRPGIEVRSFGFNALLMYRRMMAIGPALLFAGFLWAHRRISLEGIAQGRIDILRLWFAAALLGLLAQLAHDLNYLGELMPPALLLACLFAERGGRRGGPAALLGIGLATLACAAPSRIGAERLDIDDAATQRVAAMVAQAHPAPGDRLLALDFAGWVNVATDLAPPTAFQHRMHLICPFPGAGPQRLVEAFAARPRFLVIGAYRGARFGCTGKVSGWPTVETERTTNYRRLGDVQGEAGSYLVYERAR